MITEEQASKAKDLLNDLLNNQLHVILIPAPDPQFIGHMIRVANTHNPEWYSTLYNEHGYINKRVVKNALKRISLKIERNLKYDNLMLHVIDKQMYIDNLDNKYEIPNHGLTF